jgi:hypothetical protein
MKSLRLSTIWLTLTSIPQISRVELEPNISGLNHEKKVQLPQEAWDRAIRAMNGTEPMTTQVSAAALQAYQYKLNRS